MPPACFATSSGSPLFLAGLALCVLVVLNLIDILRGSGTELIAGTLIAIFLGAIFLPLGWWLLMARVSVQVSRETVTEMTDWKVGRKKTVRSLADYQGILLSVEPLVGSGTEGGRTVGIRIALVSENPRKLANGELAWFEPDVEGRQSGRALALRLASLTNLPSEDRLDEWFESSVRK